jgi:hypothetical protein
VNVQRVLGGWRRSRRLTGAEWTFIVLLLLLAAGLRLWGLTYGQPNPAYAQSSVPFDRLPLESPVHPDEYFFVSIPLQMAVSRYPNPKFYESPSFTVNVNFITYLLTGTGRNIDPAQLSSIAQREVAPFHAYVVGRVHIALSGILLVAAAYATARRLGGRYAAAAAGLLTAVSFTLVQHSHYATPSTDAAAWAAVCVWACIAALQQRRANTGILLFAGVAAGLAATTRYNVAGVSMMVFFVGLVWLVRYRAWRTVFGAWLLVPVVFVLGTPGIIFDFPKFSADFDRIFNQFLVTGVGFSQNYLSEPWLSLTFHLRYIAVFSIGLTATIAVVLGVVAAWRGRVRGSALARHSNLLFVLMLLAYLLVYTLVVLRNIRPSYNDHMLVPILAHLTVLAGFGTAWLHQRLGGSRVLGAVLIAVLIVPTLIPALQYDVLVSQPDTRYQMQQWVYDHLPRGANIHLSAPYNVPLDPADYTTTQTYIDDFTPPETLRDQGADYVILSDAWLHDVQRSAEFMTPEFVTQVRDYYASYDALPLVAEVARPQWVGPNWIMHTASYWHHPGLRLYCLTDAACDAVR